MKQHMGVWFPDHERHMLEWMSSPKNKTVWDGVGVYQGVKQKKSMEYVQRFRKFGVAVDVGGHVGLWSMHMAKRFQTIHAFEPVSGHRECYERNVKMDGACKVLLYPYALGETEGLVRIATEHGSSGNSHVSGEGDIPLKTLDSFDFPEIDFLKIDCEGYELFVCRGARETLLRCKPIIIIEQKPKSQGDYGIGQTDGIEYLKTLGAKLYEKYSGDYFMGWE